VQAPLRTTRTKILIQPVETLSGEVLYLLSLEET
jgi:hypothetical protein